LANQPGIANLQSTVVFEASEDHFTYLCLLTIPIVFVRKHGGVSADIAG
jgi:hypothetical protein